MVQEERSGIIVFTNINIAISRYLEGNLSLKMTIISQRIFFRMTLDEVVILLSIDSSFLHIYNQRVMSVNASQVGHEHSNLTNTEWNFINPLIMDIFETSFVMSFR